MFQTIMEMSEMLQVYYVGSSISFYILKMVRVEKKNGVGFVGVLEFLQSCP
jgi:hypothetical protein